MRPLIVLMFMTLAACNQDRSPGSSAYGSVEMDSAGASVVTNAPSDQSPAGILTAGEWNDHENWHFWLDLLDDPNANHEATLQDWGVDLSQRVTVVLSGEGDPVVDQIVTIDNANGQQVYAARTNVNGIAQLFPNLIVGNQGPFTIRVGTESTEPLMADLRFPVADPIALVVDTVAPDDQLDVMFVVDTTGSMGDELSYLQTELSDVISQSRRALLGDVDLRLSVNFYRDVGDEYVTRSFPFTDDISVAIQQLQQQSYEGGGDWPEAVDAALADAIHHHRWSESARARLLFLVLDAPPHQTDRVVRSLQSLTMAAAEMGIQIIPIASSGVDTHTEFFLRSIDIATNGTYVFLTDHSGVGNPHNDPTIGQYEVRPLNELLVDLITDAVDNTPHEL